MRNHNQDDGQVLVRLKDGEEFSALYSDGGGMMVSDQEPRYEVSWVLSETRVPNPDEPDGSAVIDREWRTVYQDQIERVVVEGTGEEVEFGNPYLPGHPRPQVLLRRTA